MQINMNNYLPAQFVSQRISGDAPVLDLLELETKKTEL